MNTISDDDLTEIRERNRIDEVISEHVQLHEAGVDSLRGRCPFHGELNPELYIPLNVRPNQGTFYCFGCGDSGSVVDFVMKIEAIGFVTAVERLAERVGIVIGTPS